jgi:transposase
MALELSARQWVLGFAVEAQGRPRRQTIAAGDQRALRQALQDARRAFGLAADAPVESCYEAGRDGFWVHRCLTTLGVTNWVFDSSSIEVDRRARHVKTDRVDVGKLLRLLWRYGQGERGHCRVVTVPSVAVEDARHAARTVASLVQARTRERNRIHGLLALHGVRGALTAGFGATLETLRDWAGAPLPPGLVARVREAWTQLTAIEAQLRAARQAQQTAVRAAVAPQPASAEAAAAPALSSHAAQQAQQLTRLRGVGLSSALTLATELFSRDLRNRRQVGALTGLVDVPYCSGGITQSQGVTRGGIAAVRRLSVELAWAWVQWQPTSALTQWYAVRFGGGGARVRRIGIVALARKLIIALWRYATQDVVPVGAVLRPA